MIERALRGAIVATAMVVILLAMFAAVRRAKKGGGSAAFLFLMLQFLSPIPPPRQTVEDARDAEGKRRSEDQGRDGEPEDR